MVKCENKKKNERLYSFYILILKCLIKVIVALQWRRRPPRPTGSSLVHRNTACRNNRGADPSRPCLHAGDGLPYRPSHPVRPNTSDLDGYSKADDQNREPVRDAESQSTPTTSKTQWSTCKQATNNRHVMLITQSEAKIDIQPWTGRSLHTHGRRSRNRLPIRNFWGIDPRVSFISDTNNRHQIWWIWLFY